ncbi:MAG: 4Fe-4S binding protein [Anaerolineaceae bacterium]|nr:4Fe-4S binding protein [Anaerolineaceae bacterium]
MNLLSLAERWGDALTSVSLGFAMERCLHTADKFSTCTSCYDVCPIHAIQPGGPPTLMVESCQQCRACVPVCPTGAFAAVDEAQNLLSCTQRASAQSCELVCGLNPNVALGDASVDTAVRVRGCLAGLGMGVYLGLASQGVEKVVVRLDACADCPWQALQPRVVAQVEQAQALLGLWGRADMFSSLETEQGDWRKRPYCNVGAPPVSRRDLFRWRDDEKKSAGEPEANTQTSQYHERLRFLRAIKQLQPCQESGDNISLAGLNFALVVVSNTCTACGACARACPTGALHLETADSCFQLVFAPQICIACGMCAHVCAPGALSLTPDPAFAQVFGTAAEQVVQQGSLVTCSNCRTPFAAGSEAKLCPVCEFRRQHPFGSILPPELAASRLKRKVIPSGGTNRDH